MPKARKSKQINYKWWSIIPGIRVNLKPGSPQSACERSWNYAKKHGLIWHVEDAPTLEELGGLPF